MEEPDLRKDTSKPYQSANFEQRRGQGSPERLRKNKSRKWLLFFVLGALVVISSAFLVAGFTVLLGNPFRFYEPLFTSLIILIALLALFPIGRRLILRNDQRIDPKSQLAKLHPFDFSAAGRINEITTALRDQISAFMQADQVYIFILDPESNYYLAAIDESGLASSDLRFSSNSSLADELSAQNQSLLRLDQDKFPKNLSGEKTRLELLDAQALISLKSRERLLGWVVLSSGDKKAFDHPQVIQQLEKTAGLAAIALERVQLTEDLQRRVQEMDVLTRVAQGVNVTLALDDIYELVYAQTARIIPVDVFRIVLFEPPLNEPKMVFSVQGEERCLAVEKSFAAIQYFPEYETVRSGCVYISEDYSSELRLCGAEESLVDCREWLAVPLRAGAETIGVVNIGRREASTGFNAAQQQTAQSIADLAAGAIVKARLLAESEKRTHQLKTLYDTTRQLSSTLDQERLFKKILQSAVEILDCEAGSLLMADKQSNELIFRAALGPAAGALVNQRMPAGSGPAGKSFTTRETILINDAGLSDFWPKHRESFKGFKPRSLLAAPMLVKNRVVGVIELINHRDGTDFTQDDLELLTTFASQAAVAVENATLYTMTDQALASRVEELSVMQRIDRELNASLDVKRAMKITLDWAMRQSGAAAGLVGMVKPEGIHLMASQGYADELSEYAEHPLPTSMVHLEQVIAENKPVQICPDQSGIALLDGARSQIVIPIQQENIAIGVILLESLQPGIFSQEKVEFLTRLGDHASIAIANAQLYNAIQSANVAKSEFVSFVAHELKNPMTSIKGYAELLAARAVGPVNENQASFLQVILANIDRMNKLVSDLNDLTKIEAGCIRLEFSSVALKEIVSEVERSTQRQIAEKGQRFIAQIPDHLPSVWADHDRLMQILVNLVSNAHKYTDQGGEITLGAQALDDGLAEIDGDRMVHVWVRDNGIGISEEDQARIFQKFFRSEDLKTRETPGAGLGLNITRSLVEMQGGKIWFESQYRQGTTFNFTIPVSK